MKSGSACVCVREHGLYGTGILFKECIGRVSVISCWHDHIPGQGNPRVDHDALALPSLNSACVILTEVETLPGVSREKHKYSGEYSSSLFLLLCVGRMAARLNAGTDIDEGSWTHGLVSGWQTHCLSRDMLSDNRQMMLVRWNAHRDKARFFDQWVEAVDQGRIEVQMEALELRNERLEQDVDRERDLRIEEAVKRDDQQIALGTITANRFFMLRAARRQSVVFTQFAAAVWQSRALHGNEKEDAAERPASDAALCNVEQLAHRQLEMARRVVDRMVKFTLVKTFAGWANGYQSQKQVRCLCLYFIGRRSRHTISLGFDGWHEITLEIQRQRLIAQSLSSKRLLALEHILAQVTITSFKNALDRWVLAVDMQRHRRVTCKKNIDRMRRRKLVHVFTYYVTRISIVRGQRERVQQSILRWRKRDLEKPFDAWLEHVQMLLRENAGAELQLIKQKLHEGREETQDRVKYDSDRRSDLCKRVIKTMLQRQLSMAWNEFVENVHSVKANRQAVYRVLARMKFRQLAGAFQCFTAAIDFIILERERAVQTILCWRIPGLKKAFDTWVEHVEFCLQERSKVSQELAEKELLETRNVSVKKQTAIARTVVAKMLTAALASAFDGWLSGSTAQCRRREMCRQMIKRMQHIGMHRAFGRFFESVEKIRVTRRKLAMSLSKCQKISLRLSFDSWWHQISFESQARFEDANNRKIEDLQAAVAREKRYASEERRLQEELNASIRLKMQRDILELERKLGDQHRQEMSRREACLRAEYKHSLASKVKEAEQQDFLELERKRLDEHRQEMDKQREFLESERKCLDEQRQEMDRREASLMTEYEDSLASKAKETEQREAGVMQQLQWLQAELDREAKTASRRLQQLETRNVTGHEHDDQLEQDHARIAETGQQYSRAGVEIKVQKLTNATFSPDGFRTQVHDPHSVTRFNMTQMTHIQKAQGLETSKLLVDPLRAPAAALLRDLKAMRPQQGPHLAFDGSPVLSADLPTCLAKSSGMESCESSCRQHELSRLISDLKKVRSGDKQVSQQQGINGRPGWFRT